LAQRHGLDATKTLIGLFPGSRKLEINYLLRNQVEAARVLNERFPGRFEFALSKAANVRDDFFRERLDAAGGRAAPWLKVIDDNYALLSAADLVLAASGTLTLEAALYRTPMVVMYRGPWYAYWVARALITVPHIALPNNLTPAGRRIVPELWQHEANPQRIADEALAMLEPNRYQQVKRDLDDVAEMFGERQTPQRVAEAIRRLAEER
jgi:lipid-A-disaccharide synthase